MLRALDEAVEAVLDDTVGAIGFGVPANLDRRTRRVLSTSNLPFDDFDLAAHARARFGLPVGVENDANAATLAEWKLGAGRGVSEPRPAHPRNRASAAGSSSTTGCTADGRRSVTWSSSRAGRRAQGTAMGMAMWRLSAPGPRPTKRPRSCGGRTPMRTRWSSAGVQETKLRCVRLAEIGGYLGAAIGSLVERLRPGGRPRRRRLRGGGRRARPRACRGGGPPRGARARRRERFASSPPSSGRRRVSSEPGWSASARSTEPGRPCRWRSAPRRSATSTMSRCACSPSCARRISSSARTHAARASCSTVTGSPRGS